MSFDAFSQAFAGTDWDRLAAAPVAVPTSAKAGVGPQSLSRLPAGAPPAKTEPSKAASPKDEPFLTFNDVIDIVNPLQHIPLVDAIYRRVTGDTIRPQGEILGGFLYGGLLGGAIATASLVLQEVTGIDPAAELVALVAGDGSPADAHPTTEAPPRPTVTAQNAPAPNTAAPTTPNPPATAPMASASAGTRARQAIVAGNQSALAQFAQDMAAGGQISDPPATPATPAPAPQTQGAPQARPGRMPVRGGVDSNPEPPPALYGPARRYTGAIGRDVPRNTVLGAINPARDPLVETANAADAINAPAAGTALPFTAKAPARPAPPPGVILPVGARTSPPSLASAPAGAAPAIRPLATASGFLPLARDPAIRPLNPATPLPPQALNPAEPITDAPPTPPESLTPDAIQMLMMRNLDKYRAMPQARGRIGGAAMSG